MKHPDEAVDKVFAALKDAEPPLGIERRILQAVEDHAPQPRRWLGRSVWPMSSAGPLHPSSWAYGASSWAYGATVAAVLVLALLIPANHRRPPSPTSSGNIRVQGHSPFASPPATVSSSLLPAPAVVSRAPRRNVAARNLTSLGAASPAQPPAGNDDALALEELHAASQPAPPLPLTREERFLLRLAHKGDPEELAILDPNVRAKQDVEARAEFHIFFDPPTTQQNR